MARKSSRTDFEMLEITFAEPQAEGHVITKLIAWLKRLAFRISYKTQQRKPEPKAERFL